MDFEERFVNFTQKNGLIVSGDKILAALSGGPDSVCMLLLLYDLKRNLDFELSAMYVDHGLREESAADGEFSGELCEKLGIRFFSEKVDVQSYVNQTGDSLEEAARKLRYEIFDNKANELGKAKIAVAHNLQDQAETIIFRMARGTGPRGFAGIRPVSGNIIRPLLFAKREEILGFLNGRNQSYRIDKTNDDTNFSRNRIRHNIIPELLALNEGALEHIEALSEMTEELVDEVDRHVLTYVDDNIKRTGAGYLLLTDGLRDETEVIKTGVVRKFIDRCGVPLKDISRVHYKAAAELISAETGKEIEIPGGRLVKRVYDGIFIPDEKRGAGIPLGTKGQSETVRGTINISTFPLKKDFNLDSKLYTKWFDYDKIKSPVSLRTRQTGDYLVIHPDGTRKTLKAWFIDEKVPRDMRDGIPLVASGDEILWIVGYRTGESARITGSTANIMQIDYIQDGGEGYERKG